jgi:hypothetical protein
MYKKSQKYLNFINKKIKAQYKELTMPYPGPMTWETIAPHIASSWYNSYCVEVLKHAPPPPKYNTDSVPSYKLFSKVEKKPRRIINA